MFEKIEEISLNTWPAEQSVLLDGWILRSASGYTKRSNSVNPLYGPEENAGSLEVQQKIRLAEQYYDQAELQTVFKITPYSRPAGLDHLLSELGYRKDSPSSVRMLELEQLPPVQSRHTLVIRERLEEAWVEAFSQQTGLSGAQRSTLCRMLGSSSLQHGYALLYKDGEPAACGLGVLQHGYIGLYDIVTAPAYRRQGLAEELILGLLQWGRAQGATASFLQVVLANAGASALYDKLGYKEIYQYWYRIRD